MTCDDYQIASDQRRAGATPAISVAELDAHVAACAACTAYVAVSGQVDNAMMTTLSRSPAPIDVEAIRARVSNFQQQCRLRFLWPFLVLLGLGTFGYQLVLRGFSLRTVIIGAIGAAGGTAVGYGVLMLFVRRRLAELKALGSLSGDALVAGMRAELVCRIKSERQGWWLLPALLAFCHLRFIGLAWPSLPYLLLEIAYLALPFSISFVRQRRLVRELALLR